MITTKKFLTKVNTKKFDWCVKVHDNSWYGGWFTLFTLTGTYEEVVEKLAQCELSPNNEFVKIISMGVTQ